jgi:Putative transposase
MWNCSLVVKNASLWRTCFSSRRELRSLPATACTYWIAFGPRAGQKMLTLRGAMPRETDFNQPLCADMMDFSLHAAVRCGAEDRQALEQLCRYITRPALANERVQCNAAGQVVRKLKTPWRDGTTHLVMSPLEFMQRLAALVTHPRPVMSSWLSPLKDRNPALNHVTGGTAMGRYCELER